MVGRWNFPLGPGLFRGLAVSSGRLSQTNKPKPTQPTPQLQECIFFSSKNSTKFTQTNPQKFLQQKVGTKKKTLFSSFLRIFWGKFFLKQQVQETKFESSNTKTSWRPMVPWWRLSGMFFLTEKVPWQKTWAKNTACFTWMSCWKLGSMDSKMVITYL